MVNKLSICHFLARLKQNKGHNNFITFFPADFYFFEDLEFHINLKNSCKQSYRCSMKHVHFVNNIQCVNMSNLLHAHEVEVVLEG
jgi:hypothetical protein